MTKSIARDQYCELEDEARREYLRSSELIFAFALTETASKCEKKKELDLLTTRRQLTASIDIVQTIAGR